MRQNVAVHGLFQRGLAGLVQIGQYRVEGIELMNVAMATDGRTGAAVTGALPVVQTFQRSKR